MLAERLRGQAAVICNADRVSAAAWAIKNLGSDVFVLDDAFQHQQDRSRPQHSRGGCDESMG
jgi:tetraacyldisaccharide-1-P 4'-kinase